MESRTLVPPTLAALRAVLPPGADLGDETVRAAREELGPEPDPGRAEHARRLRTWLNQWACRIGNPKPGQPDTLASSLALWWPAARDLLPPAGLRLAELTDAQLAAVSRAYGDLCPRPASVSAAGRTRSFGPTATAKLLYFLRPLAIPPWDKAISAQTGGGQDEAAFGAHLTLCRRWARALEAEARSAGLAPGEIAASAGRPAASVARLIDEWLYWTVTAGRPVPIPQR